MENNDTLSLQNNDDSFEMLVDDNYGVEASIFESNHEPYYVAILCYH